VIQTQLTAPYNVRTVPYVAGEDLNPVVNALNLQAPQLTVLVAFPAEAAQILTLAAAKPALTAANGHRWMFTDSAKSPALLAGGALNEIKNSFGFAPAQGAGTGFPAFRDSYQFKFGVDPATYSFTSHSYDAMYVVALAHAYALGAGGAFDGRTLSNAIALMETGTSYRLEPTNLSAMINALGAGTAINLEGASGKLDFNIDAGAPGAPIERWQIMPDAGFETRLPLVEPPLTH
jgi:branched-chain amino acid transport system substrate-binding protein